MPGGKNDIWDWYNIFRSYADDGVGSLIVVRYEASFAVRSTE